MPEHSASQANAEAAYESLRSVAHEVRHENPQSLYPLVGELLGTSRLLPDVLHKVAALILARSDEARYDNSADATVEVEAAARELVGAADLIDAAEQRLDAASAHLSKIAWQPAARVTPEQSLAPRDPFAARPAPMHAHGDGLTR